MKGWYTVLPIVAFLGAAGVYKMVGDSSPRPNPKPGEWQEWSEDLFASSREQQKLVILDLEAVWCHWCHVMRETTYADSEVQKVLRSKYISVRADQDSRPDLANRYEDYGWPATIIFLPDGREIVKKSGYLPPQEMRELLESVANNPVAAEKSEKEKSTSAPRSELAPELVMELKALLDEKYDRKLGGWDIGHKFLDADFAELLLTRVAQGDAKARTMLEQTLQAQRSLLDPVWGGVYQYSAGGTWREPHFEKIISVQADNIRIYAQAWRLLQNPADRAAARKTADYVAEFLTSPEGAFFTSQDADLVPGQHSADYFALGNGDRRKRGIPKVDRHIYARENGWMISALTELAAATGESEDLNRALRSANWIIANRSLRGGGFSHDGDDAAGPFLGDTLSMGTAFLRLYRATGDRHWLTLSEAAARFIQKNFRTPSSVGFLTAVSARGSLFPSEPSASENIQLARYFNLLRHSTGQSAYGESAKEAFAYVADPRVANKLFVASGALLAGSELQNPPAHITLVGKKADPQAATLWKLAQNYPLTYARVEWWDKQEGALPGDDVSYPDLPQAAIFTCSGNRCSFPAFEPEEVVARLASLNPALSASHQTQAKEHP